MHVLNETALSPSLSSITHLIPTVEWICQHFRQWASCKISFMIFLSFFSCTSAPIQILSFPHILACFTHMRATRWRCALVKFDQWHNQWPCHSLKCKQKKSFTPLSRKSSCLKIRGRAQNRTEQRWAVAEIKRERSDMKVDAN